MAPVKLPRYVIFQRDNGYNLRRTTLQQEDYLQFNTTERLKSVLQEVIPVPGYEDVVMIKSLDNSNYWRWFPKWDSNWIWANRSNTPNADNTDCHFKVVRVDDERVALQNVANKHYLANETGSSGWDWDCLGATASDYSNVSTHLRVTSALSNRRVFDVKYDWEDITPSRSRTISLGSEKATNNSSSKTDLEVVVPYIVESKYSWRTVTTFNMGFSMTVKAGIPDFVSEIVSKELSYTDLKNGEMYTLKTRLSKIHTVKDVAPGETVKVEITGSPAEATVPFKYKFVDTRVDDFQFPEDSGEDGAFVGVQVLDIKAVETRGV